MVTVQQSKFGKGLFAIQNIESGTKILKITGQEISKSAAISLGDFECYPLQIAIDKYIAPFPLPKNLWGFANHSCNPNCGIKDDQYLIAIKDIKAGEELFYDYSTTMLEKHWTMPCSCGSSTCRNTITDFDLLPIDVQQKYFKLGIILQFIKTYLYGQNN